MRLDTLLCSCVLVNASDDELEYSTASAYTGPGGSSHFAENNSEAGDLDSGSMAGSLELPSSFALRVGNTRATRMRKHGNITIILRAQLYCNETQH